MKKYIVTLTLAALPFLWISSVANEAVAQVKEDGKPPVKVPKGKTYVILDKNGKVTRTYKAGKVFPMEDGGVKCFPRPCPKGVEGPCWGCYKEQ
jgi:hypothetical protein